MTPHGISTGPAVSAPASGENPNLLLRRRDWDSWEAKGLPVTLPEMPAHYVIHGPVNED